MIILIRTLNRSNLRKRCFSKKTPLGRWTIDKNPMERDTTVDWANHDHCGSQSCTLFLDNNDEQEDIKISIKEDKLIDDDSSGGPKSLSSAVITKEEYPDDETLKYFLVSGFHLNIEKDKK